MSNLFVIDVEASGKTPHSGLMTEFAVGHVATGKVLHVTLYKFHPHPDHPALPVVDLDSNGAPVTDLRIGEYSMEVAESNGVGVDECYPDTWLKPVANTTAIATMVSDWVAGLTDSGRGSLVSDNPTFDGMWVNMFFDENGLQSPFGHSGRRIGDFAAGVQNDWKDHNSWKKLRRPFKHTHNPADDVMGNINALRKILILAKSRANALQA